MMSYSAPPVITQSFGFGGAPGGISGNPKQLNSSILSGEGAFARFGNRGIAPSGDVGPISPEHASDAPIVYSYTILPWFDNTHLMINEGMLVFLTRYCDRGIYNMAPLFRLNMELRKLYQQYEINGGNNEYNGYLRDHGEFGLEAYCRSGKANETKKEELRKFRSATLTDDFWFLTRWGILQRWNFGGVCQTKGESTGAGVYMDDHDKSDMVCSVSVNIGARAKVSNVWGNVQEGDKLYLILTRVKRANGKYGEFQWKPVYCKKSSFPSIRKYRYMDEGGRICEPFVQYVGLADMIREKNPSEYALGRATGNFESLQSAYDFYGGLPKIQVELGI